LQNTIDKKIFITLFFALFATVTGVGIVVPLLPVYAHNLGASGLYIGLIFGSFSISRTCLLPYFGRLSDRTGRKPIIVIGLLAYAVVSVAFLLSTKVSHLIVIRFFQGMASAMIMPVIQAYVGDLAPAGREGYVMGLFNVSLFIGLSVGPLAGGALNDHLSFESSFICMGVLSLVGFFLCLCLLPSRRNEAVMRKGRAPLRWRVIIGDRVMIGLIVFRMVYTAGIGIIWGFLPVLANIKFDLSSLETGFLVMLCVLVSGLVQTPMGYVADRYNRKIMVIWGGVLAGLSILAFCWTDSMAGLITASIFFGLGGGTAMPAHNAMAVVKGHQSASMGSVMALITMGHSLGMLVGALAAGLMMDWFELRWAFGMGAVMIAVGIGVFHVCVGTEALRDGNNTNALVVPAGELERQP
jgi:DHA1 family multidrug resistance protein-like MFS transporter